MHSRSCLSNIYKQVQYPKYCMRFSFPHNAFFQFTRLLCEWYCWNHRNRHYAPYFDRILIIQTELFFPRIFLMYVCMTNPVCSILMNDQWLWRFVITVLRRNIWKCWFSRGNKKNCISLAFSFQFQSFPIVPGIVLHAIGTKHKWNLTPTII